MKKTDLAENGTERMDTGDSRLPDVSEVITHASAQRRTGSIIKSLRRMLRMMAVVLTAMMTISACSNEDNDGDENGGTNSNSFPEKAAIKYLRASHLIETGETIHFFLTFDNYAKRFRNDDYGPIKHLYTGEYISQYDHWESSMVNHINKTHWNSIYNGECVDQPYNENKKIDPGITATAQELLSLGYKKQSAQKIIAGKPCDLYTITSSYGTATQGLWNNITLYLEVDTGITYTLLEALAVTLDVPEVAFTKTLDITWLPK